MSLDLSFLTGKMRDWVQYVIQHNINQVLPMFQEFYWKNKLLEFLPFGAPVTIL